MDKDLVPHEAIVESIIPMIKGDSRKHIYLTHRAAGFTKAESSALSEIPKDTLHRWRLEDEDFAFWDGIGISTLRHQYNDRLMLVKYTRVMNLVLEHNLKLAYKAVTNPSELTKEEKTEWRKIIQAASPQQFKTMKEVNENSQDDRRTAKDLLDALNRRPKVIDDEGVSPTDAKTVEKESN